MKILDGGPDASRLNLVLLAEGARERFLREGGLS